MRHRIWILPALAALLCALTASASAAFSDVPADAYYADAVSWAVERRVTDGMTAQTFCPDTPCTRAQIVSFLWKLSGRPEPEEASAFRDVDSDDWFSDAVRWASEQGIARGVSKDEFQPDRVCTRAEGAAFLHRFYAGSSTDGWLPFLDVPPDAWYRPAIRWAYASGVVNGVLSSQYAPLGSFTRAHMVAMLYRAEHQEDAALQTAVYLGVEGYGTAAADASRKDSFRYRFFSGGKTLTCAIPADGGAYVFQNHLMEGEAYRIRLENGALTRLLDAETVILTADDAADRAVWAVASLPGGAKAESAAFRSGVRAAMDAENVYLLASGAITEPPVSGEPGVRTVRNFLLNALMPVGRALYVYGGGWNWQDDAASDLCRAVALPESWQRFFQSQTETYNYKNPTPAESWYPFGAWNAYYYAGLDCSGYVGWAVYRTLNTADGGESYVCDATSQAANFAARGLGSVSRSTDSLRPGDIVSISGHVWICLGRCSDGSLVILHSTPSLSRAGVKGGGAQLGAIGWSTDCEAYRLADHYLSAHYGAWYSRYAPALKTPDDYLSLPARGGVFRWSDSALSDPDGLRSMPAGEILCVLFEE